MPTLRNANGISATIIPYGAILVSLTIPDRNGVFADVVLGHDDIEGYGNSSSYFGAVVGRYANRIANSRFTLDGAVYELTPNEGRHCLHGGAVGFDKAVWKIAASGENSLRLVHASPDGDQGFPGELSAAVTYTLSDADELIADYEATTTAPTVVNLTQHSYWNLAGAGNRDVLDHELTLAGSHFTPVDRELIPAGEIRSVAGTPFDFRIAKRIGQDIAAADQQLEIGCGYDHNFVLDSGGGEVSRAARLRDPVSGRTLDVSTTEPGIQLYTGNHLDGSSAGKDGRVYGRHGGVCLETQHFPDSPNRSGFPSTELRSGERFHSRTVFAFGVF
ncbi:MAG TPA: aldose epimerase family protein [Gemmatimonadaceae bacterium]|nr:aldose epimerase family protein [Gemmatimonadaceae bacterium]